MMWELIRSIAISYIPAFFAAFVFDVSASVLPGRGRGYNAVRGLANALGGATGTWLWANAFAAIGSGTNNLSVGAFWGLIPAIVGNVHKVNLTYISHLQKKPVEPLAQLIQVQPTRFSRFSSPTGMNRRNTIPEAVCGALLGAVLVSTK